ncbi:MAG: hypothetical protein ACFFKA_08935 [Candidatus Thorarchaeota archaeon]
MCNEELVKKMNIQELQGAAAEMLNTSDDKEHVVKAYEKALSKKMLEIYEEAGLPDYACEEE